MLTLDRIYYKIQLNTWIVTAKAGKTADKQRCCSFCWSFFAFYGIILHILSASHELILLT